MIASSLVGRQPSINAQKIFASTISFQIPILSAPSPLPVRPLSTTNNQILQKNDDDGLLSFDQFNSWRVFSKAKKHAVNCFECLSISSTAGASFRRRKKKQPAL